MRGTQRKVWYEIHFSPHGADRWSIYTDGINTIEKARKYLKECKSGKTNHPNSEYDFRIAKMTLVGDIMS